jgi:hypothetical protein
VRTLYLVKQHTVERRKEMPKAKTPKIIKVHGEKKVGTCVTVKVPSLRRTISASIERDTNGNLKVWTRDGTIKV